MDKRDNNKVSLEQGYEKGVLVSSLEDIAESNILRNFKVSLGEFFTWIMTSPMIISEERVRGKPG